MASRDQQEVSIAEATWERMFAILLASSGARTAALAERGLTPNDARALWELDAEVGRPIGELAKRWQCDPSNATFIIGRLEKAGLALREQSTGDRRVKLVRMTRKGAEMKEALMREYRRPPPEVLRLSPSDLRTLNRILGKMSSSHARK